jgi:hypothetical protein
MSALAKLREAGFDGQIIGGTLRVIDVSHPEHPRQLPGPLAGIVVSRAGSIASALRAEHARVACGNCAKRVESEPLAVTTATEPTPEPEPARPGLFKRKSR